MSRPLLPLLTVLVLLTACAEPEDDAVALDEEAALALAQGAQRLASALEGDDACGALAEADAVASQARAGVRAGTVPTHVANEVDAVTSEVTADLDCRPDEESDEADQDGDGADQDGDGADGTDPADEADEPSEPAPDPEPDPEPAPDPGGGSNGGGPGGGGPGGGGPDGDPPGQGPDGDGPPGHRDDDTGPPTQAGGSP